MKKLIIALAAILTLAACTAQSTTDTYMSTTEPPVTSGITAEQATEPAEKEEITTESPPAGTDSTPAPDAPAATSAPAGGTASRPDTPPATSTPPRTNPPATSTPPPAASNPTTSIPNTPSQPPATSTPTPSAPSVPEYEIMGLDFQKEVLKGINERRAAKGLTPARLDSSLSDECLVQAKKMADAGYAFHSEMPTGCEGTARVPYNHPADLLGDVMCTHVPDFLYESNVRIGVAVVKKGNYLYAVVQGAP